MRKIVVTGGCGFIGSNFIRLLLAGRRDLGIVNVDNLSYSGNPKNVRDLQHDSRYRFVKLDIENRPKIERVIKGAWGVVNFAAETHVDRSIADAGRFLRTNILGTHVLLEAARKAKVKRFLQISTDEVYGSIAKGSAGEETVLRPNNPYSASKAAADGLVRSYFVTHRLPAMIVRSSNNFGPYQYPEKVIPLFITNLMAEKKVPLYGHGRHQRDWLYVKDNVRAIDFVLQRGTVGEIYNIGAGRPVSNLILTRHLLNVFGKPLRFIRRVPDRPGHDFRYSLNVDKLKRLGFKVSTGLLKGLGETVRWYQENESWWRPLKNNRFTVK